MMKKILLGFAMLLGTWGAQAQSIQHTPFGDIQLLSCSTSLRKVGPTYLALAIEPKAGWRLDQPTFKVTASNDSPISSVIPFEQPYESAALYPIISHPSAKQNQSITYSVHGFWRACHDSKCITEPIRLEQTLSHDLFSLFTPECAGISLALANTPITMDQKNIKGWAIAAKDTVDITLDIQKNPNTILLYDTNKRQLLTHISTFKKRIRFSLPDTVSDDNNRVHFVAQINGRYYQIDLPILPPTTKVPPVPISVFQIIQACCLFFFLSAFPIFWGRTTHVSSAKFYAQTNQIVRLTLTIGTIMLIYLFIGGGFNLSYYFLNKTCTLIVMALAILYAPANPLLAVTFTFLAPKPYFSIFTGSNIITQACLIMGCTFITWLAFAIQQHTHKKVYHLLQRKDLISRIWWTIRIPWIALMIYTYFYL